MCGNGRRGNINRSMVMYLVSLNPNFKLVDKAEKFGIGAAGYSISCKRFQKNMDKDQKLSDWVLGVKKELYDKFNV